VVGLSFKGSLLEADFVKNERCKGCQKLYTCVHKKCCFINLKLKWDEERKGRERSQRFKNELI